LPVGDDEGGGELAAVAYKDDLADEARLLDAPLQDLRGDVLAARSLKQLLLAVGDAQVALRVERAHVAGLEPAVGGEGRGRLLRLVVVAEHDVRAARLYLAVGRCTDFDVAYRPPHGADAVVFGAVGRDDGRSLRQPVALHDGQPRAVEDEAEFFGQSRAAGGEDAYATAHALAPLREDEARGEPLLRREERRHAPFPDDVERPTLRDAYRPHQHRRLKAAALGRLVLDALVDFLVEARHGDDDCRVNLAHI